ncbi:MAG: sulfatase-like hydrolase/transferase [Myxococcota bacterium]
MTPPGSANRFPSALAAVALLGCSGAPPATPAPEPSEAAHPNVVLVSIDTTRADRIGAYGYDKALTPNLDALAARGRRYAHAYSPLPLTIPSHASLFTGKTPPTHGIRNNSRATLGYAENTLAESFKNAGYRTAASVGAYVTTRTWGFDQGFEAFFDDIEQQRNFWASERRADAVIDDILEWKAGLDDGAPQFVWVHLYDPHFPYLPPKEWREKVPDRPYDAELAWTDSQLGRLFEAWDAENTVFVVVSDHGESLGEHGEITHGLFVYDSTQHVPLLMAGPGIEPAVIDEPVGLIDVAPTLLSLLGLPALEGIDGRVAPGDPVKPVYMESYQNTQRFGLAPHIGLVDGAHKLIDTPRPELYATTDAAEATNLAEAQPTEVQKLQQALKGLAYGPPDTSDMHMDPAVVAQLEALGYTQGSVTIDPGAEMLDPKDRADLLRKTQEVDLMWLTNDMVKAESTLAELAKAYPEITEFQNRYAKSLAAQGRFDDALKAVQKARLQDPASPDLKQSEAVMLAELGRYKEAAELYLQVADEMPTAPRIRAATFTALARSGDLEAALQTGALFQQQYPDDYALAGVMGVALVNKGDLKAGIPMLALGAEASLPERDVCYKLAALVQGRGESDRARGLIERELKHWPKNTPARMTYVRLIAQTQDWDALLPQAEILRQAAPTAAESHYWVAQALFNLKRYDESLAAVQGGYAVDPEDPQLLIMHANILAKQDKRDEGAKLVEKAKAVQAKRSAAAPKSPAP